MSQTAAGPRRRAPQDASKIIASPDCRCRLERFAQQLVRLCAKYDLRLRAEEDGDIAVEDKRRAPDPDWPAVAWFGGVNDQGVYNTINPYRENRPGMRLAEKE